MSFRPEMIVYLAESSLEETASSGAVYNMFSPSCSQLFHEHDIRTTTGTMARRDGHDRLEG